MFLRTPYNYDMSEASLETAIETGDKSPTIQSAKDEVDINIIVQRFGLTGTMQQHARILSYEDFTDAFDFKTAMDRIAAAKERFEAMPAGVRAKFDNDPQNFLEFCTATNGEGQLSNLAAMREMGLAIPAAVVVKPQPQEVIVITPENPK